MKDPLDDNTAPFTPPCAFSLSSSSLISWRERCVVPRISIEPASDPAVARPMRAASVPWRKENCTLTASPRFSFGRNATSTPLESVVVVVRASMLAGVGSNASPSATASRPV